ncbi:hypothetical protein LPB67_15915 [Undibacterium sp. Jales W-56]|uniref:hypothetical protein n=1 Tax=Undibacterium sp. Jales W-56 TaxID=2897325 RepID=UPI0021D3898D|nr:hypothetical protein [Undibacterium sp. Jales W-56]MCU6435262.1 hypothetical protein [Undibacterium sp. Jales W-56]
MLVRRMGSSAGARRRSCHGPHGCAGRGAAPADLGTVFHVSDTLAARGARIAHLGARRANGGVQWRIAQHKIGRRLAQLGAIDHQTHMLRLKMRAPDFEAVGHRGLKTSCVAFCTSIDADLHFTCQGMVRHIDLRFKMKWP